ncbi:MAG: aminotransferase class I/II-fold pyridoxal phosphate-dependent enzyme [Gemmatimonadaceae bacterium]|jgi:8-amino-7-oxononanoate synthase|nr:aminotransferase class I/II-fold pyridoxal phosphate-dependent enzyme [Gemmatimonadaceae bacterium]
MSDSPLDRALADDLATLTAAHRRRTLTPLRHRRGGVVEDLEGRRYVDFASNDYLGLAGDPRLGQAAARDAGLDAVGSPASRLVTGDHPVHHRVERALAEAKGRPAALLFGSGYLANLGALAALASRDDVLYSDALNHASLIDACRLSRATLRVVPHLDVDALDAAIAADAGHFRRRWIVVESVFSMDGDVYPLDRLADVAARHAAYTYVDDAHGSGVLGAHGGGAAEAYGVTDRLDVLMGTLGKAYGTSGGFVTGSSTLVEWLRHAARSFVFTTAPAPALTAATLEALQLARAEPWRRARVAEVGTALRTALAARGVAAGGSVPHLVPVIVGDEARVMAAGAALRARGFLVGAIRPPTVPPGTARLRLSCSAAHTDAQVEALASAVAAVLSEVPA